MKYECRLGCTAERGMGQPLLGPCEKHGEPLLYTKAMKRGGPLDRVSEKQAPAARKRGSNLKRTQRRESAAESTARFHFNEMCRTRACFLFWQERPGLVCDGPRDAHHLVPKQFLRHKFSHLPERELLAILFNPLIGAPLCRRGHEEVEARTEFIYWDELSEECLEYVGSLPDFVLLRLELENPKRSPDSIRTEAA